MEEGFAMLGRPRRVLAVGVLATLFIAFLIGPTSIVAKQTTDPAMHADLDGRLIELVDVGKYYCHDFDYPAIHCFSKPLALETSATSALAATAVDYVTVYDYTSFQGAYMYFSQNYSVLAAIGWNDRISSFIVRNSQSGNFYTDWFNGGTVYPFCCNQQLPGLGTFNNTFSSVYRF
jgi:hypothetical protein